MAGNDVSNMVGTMGWRSQSDRAPVKEFRLVLDGKTYTDASVLISDIKQFFTPEACAKVLPALVAGGYLTADEAADIKRRAESAPSDITEPREQREAIMAVGAAVQKGTVPPAANVSKSAVTAANAFDQLACYGAADAIDDFLRKSR